MTETIATTAHSDSRQHPYDYYYRPGMELRPAPPRAGNSPEWLHMRRRLFSPWIKVREVPEETPLIRRLQDHLWQGDELMDAVAELSRRVGAEKFRSLLDTVLEHGIETVDSPPEELTALFEQLCGRPDWFDAELYERGRVLMANGTPFGKLGGGIVNVIMTAYGEAVSSATGATGRVERDLYRRELETQDFFRKVPLPDALDRFSDTFKTTVRVRLMHAQVRHGLRRRWGADGYAHHGDPISNTDMSLGVPAYGVVNLLVDALLGARVTMADLEAVNMYWSYTAYRFGVSADILPRNAIEAIQQFDYILSTLGKPSQWSEAIAERLLRYTREAFTSSDSGLVNRLVDKTFFPLYCGMIVDIGGDPVGYQTAGTSGFSRSQLRRYGTVYRTVGGALVRLTSWADRRPGQQRRMRARAAEGDPFQNMFHRVTAVLAEKQGLRSATFDSHDASKPTDFGKK
ncbi:oxygenase MpaB family protein [Streptomyces fulvoviolaceus]|uniref:oxygenase MpaB family protein n=1 Tax=Streptomyces fulvoviolaceus TaxID=285535 RepID=UPI0006948F90|nr:oxygenase MpaB family protein [Streptomyces fulvoviolaceus]